MYYPRVIINSSQVYLRVLKDLCNKCDDRHTSRCNECIAHEPVSGYVLWAYILMYYGTVRYYQEGYLSFLLIGDLERIMVMITIRCL